MCGIKPGEKVVSLEFPNVICTAVDDKHISYNDEEYSLSSLAGLLLNVRAIQGPKHFTYNGKVSSELRTELNPDE